MILNRRSLIGSLGLVFAAPAIVRASSLMPVKMFSMPVKWCSWHPEVGLPRPTKPFVMGDGFVDFGPASPGVNHLFKNETGKPLYVYYNQSREGVINQNDAVIIRTIPGGIIWN